MSKPRRLRVQQFRSRSEWVGYQLLAEERWWGWKTIDQIEIPHHVLISLACFGDTGGWVSPFARYGSWGRDGIINPG